MVEPVSAVRHSTRRAQRRPRAGRSASVLAAGLLTLALASCDALPGFPDADPSQAPPTAQPLDPATVAAAETSSVDPTWLCRPGEGESPLPPSTEGGSLRPEAVGADGAEITVSGPLVLEPGHSLAQFVPEGVLLPADPENRGAPAPGYEEELGVEGAPVPPMVVRGRVAVPVAEGGPAPSAASARVSVGTCDDAPLPEGQFLLRLSGALDGPGRGGADAGWAADEDVLVDVVDGRLRAVPGAVSAPTGEIPADLSPLTCGSELAAVGDGDGLEVEVAHGTDRVTTVPPEDGSPRSVGAEVRVTAQEQGTRALFQTVVVVRPSTGTIVAGARNSSGIALQWIGEEGASRTERASVTSSVCAAEALAPGTYRAHGVAVTVDANGSTHVLVSEPWDVEVHDEDPSA